MVLDDEQNGLFFDVMDSLLYYVNDRVRVVEGFTLDYSSPLDDVKSSLVAHALWDNVEIIDDFVRENPYRLPKRCLDIAASWKSALPGMYTLVRYQSGRALLMNDVGVFSVCGVTYELEDEIGPAPAYVELVLLPFEGVRYIYWRVPLPKSKIRWLMGVDLRQLIHVANVSSSVLAIS